MKSFLLLLKPKSFKVWLTYGMGLMISFMILVFIITITKESSEFFKTQAIEQAKNRSTAIAASSQVWIISNDYVGLQEVLENFSAYKDIVFISIIDMDGKILANTNKSLVGQYIAEEKRINYLQEMSKPMLTHDKEERLLLNNNQFIDIISMIHQDKIHIGMINIRINQSKLQENIDKIYFQSTLFAIIALLVAFLFSFLTANKFVGRLLTLSSVMQKVRDGSRDVRANENEVDEIANLAKEFNSTLSALNESELANQKITERLELAFEGSRDGLWDWNLLDNSIYFSKLWKEMLGYKDSEIPNEFSSWEDKVHPDDLAEVLKDVQEHIEGKTELYYNIHRMHHKEGYWVWILDRGKVLYDKSGKALRIVGTHTDITAQKKMEQDIKDKDELILSQSRHVAMGEMIGMIAHQWRQPISVIAMGANNMLADIELGEIKEENFKKGAYIILHQTKHLSKTIDDFRNFFRPDKEREEVMLCDVVNDAMSIIGKSLENSTITLNKNIQDNISIETYSRELLQVFINLIKNSKEALEENTPDNRFINIEIIKKDEYAVVTLCDNGGGIDPEIINRIYEPYFSTKDQKTGTGLGLNMSKIIIEQHLHGTIKATNSDDGVCFEITIPIVWVNR